MKTLVVFDLEATCWEDKGDKITEIIEIGAVRINKETGTLIDSFDLFVKPRLNPILSDFCKELTSIRQEDIELGYDFIPAMDQFYTWLKSYNDDYIMSWGYYDKNQIERESTLKNYNGDILNLLKQKHLNAKNQFAHIFGAKRCGIVRALKMLGLEFDGTHHRGIDDCKNIARIYSQIREKFFDTIYNAD